MNDPRKLRRFLLYTFRQRYGREEEGTEEDLPLTARQENGHSHVSLPDSQLDIVINWYLGQPVSEKLLQAYLYIITKTSSLPCVRRGTIATVLTWLGKRGAEMNADGVFPSVKTFLVTALMDVWSAIRKSTAAEVTKLAAHLSADRQEEVFKNLTQICLDDAQTWQAKDGAILGINAMLECNRVQGRNASLLQQDWQPPDYMSSLVPRVVFSLVSHPQLTIRETAARVLSTYISCVHREEAVSTLEKVTSQLSGTEFVDAYQAEGLIDITALILKGLPLSAVLWRWKACRAALLKNLGHPASSVRQVCSSVCLQLVDMGRGNPAVLLLVLQSLLESLHLSKESTPSTVQESWEGVEGRMFVFESVCQLLVKDHCGRVLSPPTPSRGKEEEGWLRSLTKEGKGSVCPPCLQSSMEHFLSASLLARVSTVDALGNDLDSQSTHRWLLKTCFDVDTDVPDWLGEITFTQGRQLLASMLECTTDCWGHSQWELRRIAQQVLPLLGETMHWYDADWAAQVWQTALKEGSKLQACVGLYLLRDALHHAARLSSALQAPHPPWKTNSASRLAADKVVTAVADHVGPCLSHVERMLARPTADRISVLAVEVLLSLEPVRPGSHGVANGDSPAREDPVLTFWQHVFAAAHPSNQMTTSLLLPTPESWTFPGHGYLSCCVVGTEERSQCARQVERSLVTALSPLLAPHLRGLPIPAVCSYLPLLVHSTGLFHADSNVCPALLHSLTMAGRRAVRGLVELADHGEHLPSLLPILISLRELSAVIAIKSLEVGRLEMVLSVYLLLSCLLLPQHHLPTLINAITARLQEGSGSHPMMLPPLEALEPADLWNPDSAAAVAALGQDAPQTEGEPDVLKTVSGECLSLSQSLHLASSNPVENGDGGERQAEGEEDEDSDWDSEEEEEENEEASGIKGKFKEFFQKMAASLGKETFQKALQGSKAVDRSLVEELTSMSGLDT